MKKKCGYVALLGRPNAGKSTFLNAILGSKLAVVSNKPQTTRNKILGIFTESDCQILLLDTPGIHQDQGLPKINQMMNKTAWNVLAEADLVCYLIDVSQGWHPEDTLWLKGILKKYNKKLLLLATKSDKVKIKEAEQERLNIEHQFQNLLKDLSSSNSLNCQLAENTSILVSSKTPEHVVFMRKLISTHMPISDWLFGEDDLTDRSQKFVCSEIIREQIFRQLGQELPYKIAVVIEKFTTEQKVVKILATLIVDRESQKGIVIGKKGVRLKNIGMLARVSLEKHLEKKVFLELFVKVKPGWTENLSMLSEFADLHDLSETN